MRRTLRVDVTFGFFLDSLHIHIGFGERACRYDFLLVPELYMAVRTVFTCTLISHVQET